MKFNKKHFFIIVGINFVLPLLFFFVISREDLSEHWLSIIGFFTLAFIIVTVCVFFISWLLFFVITGGKDPKANFHLIPQYLITAAILFIFGYRAYNSWHFQKFEYNIGYNKEFLDSHGASNHDTLYQEAFKLLEDKYEDRNDIKLQMYTSDRIDTVINNIHDSVRVVYFMYSLKNNPGELVSKHIVGKQVNQLVYYNTPVYDLPFIAARFGKMVNMEKKLMEQESRE